MAQIHKRFSDEQVWGHIEALRDMVLRWGYPYQYYVDQHSIFRFVRNRDDRYYKQGPMTDEYLPQWKQVLKDCGIKVIYALSAQAKGKIEAWPVGEYTRIHKDQIPIFEKTRKIKWEQISEGHFKRDLVPAFGRKTK